MRGSFLRLPPRAPEPPAPRRPTAPSVDFPLARRAPAPAPTPAPVYRAPPGAIPVQVCPGESIGVLRVLSESVSQFAFHGRQGTRLYRTVTREVEIENHLDGTRHVVRRAEMWCTDPDGSSRLVERSEERIERY